MNRYIFTHKDNGGRCIANITDETLAKFGGDDAHKAAHLNLIKGDGYIIEDTEVLDMEKIHTPNGKAITKSAPKKTAKELINEEVQHIAKQNLITKGVLKADGSVA